MTTDEMVLLFLVIPAIILAPALASVAFTAFTFRFLGYWEKLIENIDKWLSSSEKDK